MRAQQQNKYQGNGHNANYYNQGQIPMQMQELHSDEEKQYYLSGQKNNKKSNNMNKQAIEACDIQLSPFSDQIIRRGFIRKVMCIIGLQFLITSAFVVMAMFHEGFKDFQQKNQWMLAICFIFNLITLICLYCFRTVCKEVPKNYILLFLFTISESYIISFLCGISPPGVVLLTTLLLSGIVFSLVLYAIFSDKDITMKIMFIFYASMAVLVIIIVASAFENYTAQVLIGLVIILLFMAYLVFDIQRLTGGNQIQYQIDDYIIAALDIYIDIIVIFKQLLLLMISK